MDLVIVKDEVIMVKVKIEVKVLDIVTIYLEVGINGGVMT